MPLQELTPPSGQLSSGAGIYILVKKVDKMASMSSLSSSIESVYVCHGKDHFAGFIKHQLKRSLVLPL